MLQVPIRKKIHDEFLTFYVQKKKLAVNSASTVLTRKNYSFPLIPAMKTKICQCVLWEMPLIIVYYDQKE